MFRLQKLFVNAPLDIWINDRVPRDRPRMNSRRMPAGISIVNLPYVPAYVSLQYHHVMTPDRNSASGWRCAWEAVPIGGKPQAAYRTSEHAHRRPAAAECPGRTSVRVGDDVVVGVSHMMIPTSLGRSHAGKHDKR